jgi:predicted aconitase with swiveling domain
MIALEGETLAPGLAEGPLMRLAEPLSFWGGYDAATGRIIDHRHADHGRACAGAVLALHAGRGSSSGSSVLAEAIRAGTAPAAILLARRDPVLTVGALVAAELYGWHCPVIVLPASLWPALREPLRLRVEAEGPLAAIRSIADVCLPGRSPL